MLSHAQGEGRLSHCRAGCDDDKVWLLPSASDAVEFFETTGDSAQTVTAGGSFLEHVVSLTDDGINLGIVSLHVVLRKGEKIALSFLHEFVYILSGVKGLSLNTARIGNEFASQVFLGDDVRMILDVGRRSHEAAQLCDVERAASVFQVAVGTKLLGHGEDVYWLILNAELLDGFVDELVAVFVETFRAKELADLGISVFFNHEGTEYGLLNIWRLGLQVAQILWLQFLVFGFVSLSRCGHQGSL